MKGLLQNTKDILLGESPAIYMYIKEHTWKLMDTIETEEEIRYVYTIYLDKEYKTEIVIPNNKHLTELREAYKQVAKNTHVGYPGEMIVKEWVE